MVLWFVGRIEVGLVSCDYDLRWRKLCVRFIMKLSMIITTNLMLEKRKL